MDILEKLRGAEDRFREIEQQLTLPDVAGDNRRYSKLMAEYRTLAPVVEKFRSYREEERYMRDAEEMAHDATLDSELRALAEEESFTHREKSASLYEQLRLLLVPRDPRDGRNVLVEIRAGTGGEEAALFAADLYRMYTMYAPTAGFRIEPLDANPTELGGYKEIIFRVVGDGAYSRFKFESGIHRVQRVPVTESNGRIQTSAVTVAVLAEAEAVDVEINPQDIHFESCKSSGAGGQHINKTESAVRLTYKPLGIVVECDQERSQLQNKERALRLLYTKLYDLKVREQRERIASDRRSQVGSGDRSEKIRTYNFPQSRVTDHRINKTLYTLQSFLNGDIGGMITDLMAADAAEKLRRESHDN